MDARTFLELVIVSHDSEVTISDLLRSAGQLAPSTHNTQPWEFITSENTLKIKPDTKLSVPHADPESVYLHISVGACIANILYVLEGLGIKSKHTIQKNGTCVVEFEPAVSVLNKTTRDRVRHILFRQNYRGKFLSSSADEKRFLEAAVAKRKGVKHTFSEANIQSLANATGRGVEKAYSNEGFRKEISSHIHSNLSRSKTGLHGYSLRMNTPISMIMPLVMKRVDIGGKLADLNVQSFSAAQCACIVTVNSAKRDPAVFVRAGIEMESLMLDLASAGLQASTYVAALEQEDTRDTIREVFECKAEEKPVVMFTVGKPSDRLKNSKRRKI